MLVLFETSAGYAIFKLLDEKKLQSSENLYLDFESPESASKLLKLKHFKKFDDTTEALAAATAAVEGKMGKTLKSVLKKIVVNEAKETLAVADAKLGNSIKEKLNIACVSNSAVQDLMRCIRTQTESLISGLPQKDMSAMSLGLAHSLSRYKLKFSPDKVDTMIVQAISLLDDLDKELNNYVMRAREWYGWHFPEMGKILTDNMVYAKAVLLMGCKLNCATTDFSPIMPEELEEEVKAAAEISMGTEVSESDLLNISSLCTQVIEISEYRNKLYDYLKNRMVAIAPNLTVLVGELVGARLIAHAGSLMNLAKHPSSTVQILGAEKALFRALKTKHDTPKYGLLYHAMLVSSSSAKNKGKVSRMLAAKASLAIRVDALGEGEADANMGMEHRAKLESRLRAMEEGHSRKLTGSGKKQAQWDKYENKSEVKVYNPAADSTLPSVPKKRKHEDSDDTPKKKKIKKEVKEENGEEEEEAAAPVSEKKKKKKKKSDDANSTMEVETPVKKKKKKAEPEEEAETPVTEKKKKKKRQSTEAAAAEEDVADESMSKKKKKKIKQELEETLNSTADSSIGSEKKKKKKKNRDSISV
ncbi:hypothetical protein CAPTEDRAFT_162695 [Capitella teleta]|uniref:Nucleolar protein 58 n=1 Tax=Capitella teleta TaxID=283909 RepID=R7TA99_CAPTE|nr:hypothetical protein CAPTEDRAFT_162695 [Capitella teleta]|eukprot:ELT87939.1 hypothetical protein CAPTEDRAFT_162695 [Capitella teleta]